MLGLVLMVVVGIIGATISSNAAHRNEDLNKRLRQEMQLREQLQVESEKLVALLERCIVVAEKEAARK